MKKIIIGIIILIIISIIAVVIYESVGVILVNNKIKVVENNISKNQLKKAQDNLVSLENSNYKINEKKEQQEHKLRLEIQNLSYDNLQPFLKNNKLEGTIDNKYAVTMVLDKCKKIDGDIIATEYYNDQQGKILDLKIISNEKGKCIIDESYKGNPIGIYRLTFNNEKATGTYEYFPTGKKSSVTMEFKK